METEHPSAAALLIGVAGNSNESLVGIEHDIASMNETLRLMSPSIAISTLVGDEATVPAINRHLSILRREPAELTILYFSGHGCRTDVDSYLWTWDAEEGNEGLPLSLLARQMPRSGPGSSWLAILDCCHSTPDNLHKPGISSLDIEQAFTGFGGSRAVMAACGPNEVALEVGSVSPFTRAVVAGLRGNAANHQGDVTLGAVFDQVCEDAIQQGLPAPVLVGDLASSFVLGRGYPPRGSAPLRDRQKEQVILEADRLSSALRSYMAVPEETWKDGGWLEATRAIRPVVRWFEGTSARNSEVLVEPSFVASRAVVDRHVAYLASLSAGIRTSDGVLGTRLGRGGFGTVWTMTPDDEDAPSRAVKVYHADELHDRDKRSRFERGFRAMERLDHEQIVRVVRYSATPPMIVMELVDGMDLRAIGQVGSIRDQLDLLDSVSRTLAYAHAKDIVHRDIKPENVLVRLDSDRQTPILTDFDLAWFPTATQITMAAMGHAFYAAPEQIQDPESGRSRDPRVDVYSFGQLLFFVMTGRDPKPFSPEENANSLAEHLGREGIRSSAIDQLVNIYTATSSVDRKARFSTISDATAAFQALSLDDAVEGEQQRLTFRAFCGQIVGRAKGKVVSVPANWKVLAISGTSRTSIELLLDPQAMSRGENVVQVRFKVYDLKGLRIARTSHAVAVRINRRRMDAMEASDPEVMARVIGGPFRLAELRTTIEELSIEEARRLGRRVQSIVSAGERVV